MSSNAYGFEAELEWGDHNYFLTVILRDSGNSDSYEDLDYADSKLEKLGINPRDEIQLATRELSDRDWNKKSGAKYIDVWSCYAYWNDNDTVEPPQPTVKEVMIEIAKGKLKKVVWGWDT